MNLRNVCEITGTWLGANIVRPPHNSFSLVLGDEFNGVRRGRRCSNHPKIENSRLHITDMDGNFGVCCNLAAWPAGGLAQMGLCCRAGQSIGVVLYRHLSSTMGACPGELLVYVFMDSGSVEFLGEPWE